MCAAEAGDRGLTGRQIIPTASNGNDAVNFRQLKESHSLHLEDQLAEEGEDLFGAFSSVTLHYDGES